ncbi:hypothetical protein GDO86_011729 [Hymenochirus boettgeri]|nr:hypothetical protein GDO86_011729 [Hymenochirus boettgeri]
MADLLIWETSGQWLFSVLRNPKINKNLSGFEDISQEELRFEYYVCQAEGILPKYGNTVQLLLSKWKQRALEIKNLTPSAKATLLNELNSSPDSLNSGFGGQNSSAFGSSGFPTGNTAPTAATFSFKPEAALAQKTGETSNKLTFPGFGSKPLNTAGFGTSSTAPTAASFSFAPSNTGSQPPAPAKVAGFGSSTSTATGPAFGGTLSSTVPSVFGGGSFAAVCTVNEPSAVSDLFSAKAQAPQPATSLFKQPTGPSGPAPTSTSVSAIPLVPPSSASGSKCSPLFTQRNELSAEELAQFEAKRFVLGQIPLKPPPADLLVS